MYIIVRVQFLEKEKFVLLWWDMGFFFFLTKWPVEWKKLKVENHCSVLLDLVFCFFQYDTSFVISLWFPKVSVLRHSCWEFRENLSVLNVRILAAEMFWFRLAQTGIMFRSVVRVSLFMLISFDVFCVVSWWSFPTILVTFPTVWVVLKIVKGHIFHHHFSLCLEIL
jgi:hypothetical protein